MIRNTISTLSAKQRQGPKKPGTNLSELQAGLAQREEWRRLSEAFGLCIPIADLKSPAPNLALALHIGEHRPFYLMRDEDKTAREHLQEKLGLLIIGRPLSGKTRMALEAILAVVPDGVLLRFSGPQRLLKLDGLVISLVAISGKERKVDLVVFFDDIDRFDGAPFDDLIDRLYPQVSKLYVVATCQSGAAPRVLASSSLKNLRAGPFSPSQIVEIRPLTQLEVSQVEKEVWKTYPGRDLGLDRTEVGVILRGTKTLGLSYENVTPEGRCILRALFLAECFALPCPEGLLLGIVEGVVQHGPFPSFDATLAALVEANVVQRDDLSRLSLVSHYHRDKVIQSHYSTLTALRQDLKQVELVLKEKGDATHLTALGVYYGDRMGDLGEARRVLELSLKVVQRADTLFILSLVLARASEDDAAQAILEECLMALSEPDRQAKLLIRFADELISKQGGKAAVPFYERARGLAQTGSTKVTAAFRCGDALFSDNAFESAEPIYREIIDHTPEEAKHIAAARLVVAIVGQRHFELAAHELREQLHGHAMEFRHSLATAILENGENRFLSDERLTALRQLVWDVIRDTAEAKTRTDDLLAFASDMIFRGFLSESKIAYSELRTMAGILNLKPAQGTTLLNNLATCYLYLQDPKEARPLFEETLSLLRSTGATQEYFLAAAEDGIAACDVLEENLQAGKKRYEELLRTGKAADNDTIQAWAHVGLGTIAWQEENIPVAYDHFFALRTIPSSFDTIIRTALGLARVCLHNQLLDDAAVHIARGLAATSVRADYAYLRKEFEKLKQQLADGRTAKPAMAIGPVVRRATNALIMKGGGVKGLAFAGAIRELEKCFEFEAFVGTSAGAVAAALLAAGATGVELEEKFRRKSFRDFLDGRLRVPFTFWALGGHPGITFMDWLRLELSKFVHKVGFVNVAELPKRAVIYAATRGGGEVTFDKLGEHSDTAVHTAVRCSMSIPYFFQAQSLDNRRVFDGGLLNNYPVEIFLQQEKKRKPQASQPTFIALYLGSDRPASLKLRSQIADILSIWLEKNDARVIDEYRKDTVIIDTDPVSTIDFDLTEEEKDFLVIEGRAAALEFLKKRGVLNPLRGPAVEQTRVEAERLRVRIKDARRKRRISRCAVAMIIGFAILALGFWIFR